MIYRIVFPKGISVTASDEHNLTITKGKTSDDRIYIEFSFPPESMIESDVLTCSLTASPLYLVGLFIPCILSFVLVIILIVVVYLIRKKRRGGGKIFHREKPEQSGYEGEDYYVPPPPGS
jgi:hypothetical protein